MTDYIFHKEDVFYSLMNCPKNTDLVKKLSELLDKYACFHDYTSFTSYKSKKTFHQPIRRKISNPNFTNIEREVTCLLNKITRSNYKSISRQILDLVNDNNLEIMIQCVLDKCQKQTCFLDLYISILMEINNKASLTMKHSMSGLISSFIDDFIAKREFNDYQLDGDNYDEFCSNVSNKKHILGKHKTVLELMVKVLKNDHIDDYFDSMFNEVIEMDKEQESEHQDKRELVLEILQDFTKVHNKYQIMIKQYYSSNNEVLDYYSMKAKFKVMDITQLRHFK
jgi:hypothetical protein